MSYLNLLFETAAAFVICKKIYKYINLDILKAQERTDPRGPRNLIHSKIVVVQRLFN